MIGRDGRDPAPSDAPRRSLGAVTIHRSFPADIEKVWDLWTSKAGLERWWGPDDVVLTVERLDLRPGGAAEFRFAYRPVVEDPSRQAEFDRAGVPTTYTARGEFTVAEPPHRLAFSQVLDFGRPRPTLALEVDVRLSQHAGEVAMTLTVKGTATAHWKSLAETSLREQAERLVRAAGGFPARPAHA